jgi:hypothetical protein
MQHMFLESESLQIQPNMTYDETPMRILDRKDQVLRNKSISLVKVFVEQSLSRRSFMGTGRKYA